jgi:hypothetical protein
VQRYIEARPDGVLRHLDGEEGVDDDILYRFLRDSSLISTPI